ncbi:MAG: choice-of-anchor D domain-containing protein [Planctomycetes bacterium]|nr:choice-of-anchor D domain-containing protein [Planctomycetota bacterium]
MRIPALILLFVASAVCAAQDYGDAPASYGTAEAFAAQPNISWLGNGLSVDTQNPITPAWTGDQLDDGILVPGPWSSWSSTNQITVMVRGSGGFLLMWVDADDNGTFDSDEMYEFMPGYWLPAGDYTFENVNIHATQDFTRNGQNKVAVRVMIQDTFGLPIQHTPNAHFWWGEIEDWLLDVEPAQLSVRTELLREATETESFAADIKPVNGVGPYTWAQVGGSLPTGLSLGQQGDNFVLAGTPAIGTASEYTFTVEVTDATSASAQRTFKLEVTHTPFALPFVETFSSNHYWKLDSNWAIAQATGFVGAGASGAGYPAVEPAQDFTPGNNDNLMLLSSPNGEEPDLKTRAEYAMSPKINCSGASEVQLRFRRWYSVFVHPAAKYGNEDINVSITSDGVNWDKVWVPPYEPLTTGLSAPDIAGDREWTRICVDISQWAANKPWIRLRFQIGEYSINNYFGYGLTGWGVDDIEVRKAPLGASAGASLVAHDLQINSPTQAQNPATGAWQPLLYPQAVHSWQVKLDNTSTHDVTVNSVEGTSLLEVFATSAPDFIMASADCWHDWGDWILPQPVTVPAGATNYAVTGEFHFHGVLPQYWLAQGFHAVLYLQGVQSGTNELVELSAQQTYLANNSPLPGVYVYEYQVGGTQVLNGASAPTGSDRNFNSVSVGSWSAWSNIIIENSASTQMSVGTPTLTGADAGDFELYLPTPTQSSPGFANTIPGGDWVWFSVRFRPGSGGQKTATVQFTHTAANTSSPFVFEVTGFGSANAPIIEVRETNATGGTIPNGGPATGIRDFGQVDIAAGPTASHTVYVANVGTQLLTLGVPALTGADAADFSLNTSGMPAALAPGASATFTFSFDPTTTGIKTAAITIAHNDPGTANPFTVLLVGEGIIAAPLISVATSSTLIQPGSSAGPDRQFGVIGVNAGAAAPIRIYLTNNGWTDLVLSMPTVAAGNTADFTLDTSSFNMVLGYQASTWFEIVFDPTAKGLKSGWISFTHNDTTVASPFDFEVKGYGDDPNGVIITTTQLTPAQIDQPYATQLGAAQGTSPYSWTLTGGSLPPGLSLDAGGSITGTPTGIHGTTQFEVMVTDATGGTEVRTVQLILQPPVGYVEKSQGKAGGGCIADADGVSLLWLLALLPALWFARIRHRRA